MKRRTVFDSSDWNWCEWCNKPIAPSESKTILGYNNRPLAFNADLGTINGLVIKHASCTKVDLKGLGGLGNT